MVVPTLLIGRGMRLLDALAMMLLYGAFSLAAMVVLGIPALFIYAKLRWTGFVAFMAGGAVCAAATYAFAVRRQMRADHLTLFTTFGVVEGLFLRLLLFGARAAPYGARRVNERPTRPPQ